MTITTNLGRSQSMCPGVTARRQRRARPRTYGLLGRDPKGGTGCESLPALGRRAKRARNSESPLWKTVPTPSEPIESPRF